MRVDYYLLPFAKREEYAVSQTSYDSNASVSEAKYIVYINCDMHLRITKTDRKWKDHKVEFCSCITLSTLELIAVKTDLVDALLRCLSQKQHQRHKCYVCLAHSRIQYPTSAFYHIQKCRCFPSWLRIFLRAQL